MAGDWIKMRADLVTHPKVVRIASALKADKLRVIGGLHAVWSLFDAHSADGILDGYTADALDDHLGWPGFCASMVKVGWLEEHGESLTTPRFDEHNGQSAKRRAQETERKRLARATPELSAPDADKKRSREEKRREEVETDTSAAKLPTCPHAEIISLYHEILPEMAAVRMVSDVRKRAIAKVWNWTLTSSTPEGDRRATNRDQAVAWFRRYFERARANDFLMGRTPKTGEHAGWACDLDFLLTDKGMKQVIEKTLVAA